MNHFIGPVGYFTLTPLGYCSHMQHLIYKKDNKMGGRDLSGRDLSPNSFNRPIKYSKSFGDIFALVVVSLKIARHKNELFDYVRGGSRWGHSCRHVPPLNCDQLCFFLSRLVSK